MCAVTKGASQSDKWQQKRREKKMQLKSVMQHAM